MSIGSNRKSIADERLAFKHKFIPCDFPIKAQTIVRNSFMEGIGVSPVTVVPGAKCTKEYPCP